MNAASEQVVHNHHHQPMSSRSQKKLSSHHSHDEIEDDEETISTATSSSSSSADSTMALETGGVIKSVNVSNASLSSDLSSDHEQTKAGKVIEDAAPATAPATRPRPGGVPKSSKTTSSSSSNSSKKPNRLQKPYNGGYSQQQTTTTTTTITMQVHPAPVLPQQQVGGVSAQPYHHHHRHHPILPASPYYYPAPNAAAPTGPGNIPPPPMMAPVFAPATSNSSSSSSSSQQQQHLFVGPNGGQLDPAHWSPMALAYGPDPMGAYYNYQNPEFYSTQSHFEPINYGSYTPTSNMPYSYTGDYSTAATTSNSSTNLSVTTSNTTLQAADSKKPNSNSNGAEPTAMHSTSSSSASSASSWSPSSSQHNNKNAKNAAKNTASTNSPSKQQADSSAVSSASTSSSNLLQQQNTPLSMPTYSNGSSSSSGLPYQSQWITLDPHSYPIPAAAYHYQIPPLSLASGRNPVNGNTYYANRPPGASVFPQQAPVPFAPAGKGAHHTSYFSAAAPAPHHQPIELASYHQDPSNYPDQHHHQQQQMPASGNRSSKLDASFNAMNLNGADDEQGYFEHQLQPASFNYNSRYKSKSKKNGRLNYTSNQYRSAQNRMSRGYYQDDMPPESGQGLESHINDANNGEFERDQSNEGNQFELQDYKRTMNMVHRRGYGSDQLRSDDTPFISGDSATSSASQFSSEQYQRPPKNFSKSLSYKQQQYRDYQRQQQKQYGSSFDYDKYQLSRYLPEENYVTDAQGFDSNPGGASSNQRRPSLFDKNDQNHLKSGSFSSSSSHVNNNRDLGGSDESSSKQPLDDQGQRRKERERSSRYVPAQPTIFSFLSKADKKNLFQGEPASATTSSSDSQENKTPVASQSQSPVETVAEQSTEPEEAGKLVPNPPKVCAAAPRAPQPSVIVPEPIVDFTSSKQLIEHKYNPREFITSPKQARFFVIKSYSEDDIHRSIKYGIWCSTEHGNRRLDQAFSRGLNSPRDRQFQAATDSSSDESQIRVPVYLFFSVNGSGHFCGMAQMLSRVDYNSKASVWSQQDKWRGCFQVKWVYVKDIPNSILRNIRLENNENKPVTNSRDTQEIPFEKGKQVLKIFHTFNHTSSIFDDFEHYENLQNKTSSSSSSNERARSAESETAAVQLPLQECSSNHAQNDKRSKFATGRPQGERDPAAKTSRNSAPNSQYSYQQKRPSGKENSATFASKPEEKEETLNMNNLLMFPSLSASMTMTKEPVSSKSKAKPRAEQPSSSSSSSSSEKGTILESVLIDNNNNSSDKGNTESASYPAESSEENNKPSALVK